MRISVFGLGYVGTVSAACLSRDGHTVVGVDPNPTKVELINAGRSPIIESGVDELVAEGCSSGRIRATDDVAEAVDGTELSLVCVGTPSQANGSLELTYVERVCEEIGRALADADSFHVVAIRSTMLPGTVRDLVIPTLQRCSGRTAGSDFGVCINPEFLREGTAVRDFDDPPKTVIGSSDDRSAQVLAAVYESLDAPVFFTSLETAEMVKYTDNVFHALKVGFANEIGNICKELGIDSHEVMDIFCEDRKLNLSPYYLKPGFAFGGSCLPKDVRALTYKARSLDLDSPILNGIMASNRHQLERALNMVTSGGERRIGVLGFAFKAGTDDLRESPTVELIETLIGKGYDLRLYDHSVSMAALTGANKDYILNRIPHISKLMVDDPAEVTSFAEVIVVGNKAPEFVGVLRSLGPATRVVDLVRILDAADPSIDYNGLCW